MTQVRNQTIVMSLLWDVIVMDHGKYQSNIISIRQEKDRIDIEVDKIKELIKILQEFVNDK